jgi:hypothetical protein
MRKQTKALLIASAFVTSLVMAPALLARDGHDRGMMGRGGMMGNGGMMGMMGSMKGMMEHCGRMMGNNSRQPNDQWQKAPPAPSEKR